MSRPDKYSTCLKDGTPLISTFEVRKKEWHCMTCGDYVEFMHTGYIQVTDELEASYLADLARFRDGERGPTIEA